MLKKANVYKRLAVLERQVDELRADNAALRDASIEPAEPWWPSYPPLKRNNGFTAIEVVRLILKHLALSVKAHDGISPYKTLVPYGTVKVTVPAAKAERRKR